MLLPEVPTGYTREMKYPKGNRSSGIDSVQDKIWKPLDEFDFDELYDFENLDFEGMTVNSLTWDISETQARIYIVLNYSEPSSVGVSWSATLGKAEYSLDDSGTEIPIDKRKNDGSLWFPNYRISHNYILCAKNGIEDAPSWWLTATDLSSADNVSYKWIKEVGELPDGWYIMMDVRKNIESVLCPSPVVVETTRFKSYDNAVRNIVETGTVKEPAKTFNKAGQWLVVSSSVSQDGKHWVITTRYQLAPEWDSDYYNTSS